MPEVIIYMLIALNVLSFLVTAYDKIAAKTLPKYRVPEKILIAMCIALSGVGVMTACVCLRHKTRKLPLFLSMLFITLTEIAAFCFFAIKTGLFVI